MSIPTITHFTKKKGELKLPRRLEILSDKQPDSCMRIDHVTLAVMEQIFIGGEVPQDGVFSLLVVDPPCGKQGAGGLEGRIGHFEPAGLLQLNHPFLHLRLGFLYSLVFRLARFRQPWGSRAAEEM